MENIMQKKMLQTYQISIFVNFLKLQTNLKKLTIIVIIMIKIKFQI